MPERAKPMADAAGPLDLDPQHDDAERRRCPAGSDSITPDCRLGALLERWPELEQALLDLSPQFRALQNPVLRRTVAKVATLRQMSLASGVPLGTIIARLRAVVGLDSAPGRDCAGSGDAAQAGTPRPDWAVPHRATRTRDARAAIERGEHPLGDVMRDLSSLRDGEVYQLVTAFVPAPLVDTARAKGFRAHWVTEVDGVVRTFLLRGAAGP